MSLRGLWSRLGKVAKGQPTDTGTSIWSVLAGSASPDQLPPAVLEDWSEYLESTERMTDDDCPIEAMIRELPEPKKTTPQRRK